VHAAPAVVLPFWLDRPPGEAVDVALEADRLGFHELWIGEMLHFDAFALAGALATRTRLTLCVGPLAAGVRDPVSLARGVASVAVLGDRPARLALGASTPAVVEGWHGRPWGGEPERMKRVIDDVRRLLAGERTHHRFRSALGPQPSHVSVAAFGSRMLRVAAERGDRVVVNLVTPAQVRRIRREVAGAATSSGHLEPPVTAWVVAALEPGPATRGQLAAQLALYLGAPGYAETFEEAGFGELVADARAGRPARELAAEVPEDMLESVTAYGSAEAVLERIAAYREAGAEPAIVPATADDPGGRRVLGLLAGV
jgi:probable F420-dependent oxidoreductase